MAVVVRITFFSSHTHSEEAAHSACCWNNSPDTIAAAPRKKGLHKAKDDILESIDEAKFYKTAIFQAAKP